MKAALFQGNKKYFVAERRTPKVTRPEEVVVQIESCAICGSDIEPHFLSSKAKSYVPGHEPAGIVTEIGTSVEGLTIGDSVVMNCIIGCGKCEYCDAGMDSFCKKRYAVPGFGIDGAFAEFMKVPHYRAIFHFPRERLGYDEASMLTDCLGTSGRAVRRAEVNEGDTVAVYGAGPLGLCAIQLSRAFGAETVVAVDKIAFRLEMASDLGADFTVNASEVDPVKRVLELVPDGVEVAFEMAGHNPITGVQVLESVKVGGRAHFTGENNELTINPSKHIVHKQVTITGNWGMHRGDFEENLGLVLKGKVNLKSIITHRFSLDDIEKAFRKVQERGKEKVGKVVLNLRESG